jgi:hypothetical protein
LPLNRVLGLHHLRSRLLELHHLRSRLWDRLQHLLLGRLWDRRWHLLLSRLWGRRHLLLICLLRLRCLWLNERIGLQQVFLAALPLGTLVTLEKTRRQIIKDAKGIV